MSDKRVQQERQLRFLLIAVVTFNVIPHVVTLPIWISSAALLTIIWSVYNFNKNRPPVQRWVRNLLAFIACLAVIAQYRTLAGQEPATALLVFLATLKLLEVSRYRDAMLVVFISYFLLMTHVLESQSILSTIYMAVDVMFITILMYHLHYHDRRISLRAIRPALKLLLSALPLWIFIFMVFPRFSTRWNPEGSKTGSTSGFSDSMAPGEIESLVESDAPVFRVEFPVGRTLSPGLMYWRGSILWHVNGLSWGQEGTNIRPKVARKLPERDLLIQTVILEPGYGRHLFALDQPQGIRFFDESSGFHLQRKAGYVFESDEPTRNQMMYEAHSILNGVQSELSEDEKKIYLQVEPPSERVQSLLNEIAAQAHTVPEKTLALLKYYEKNGFRYTHSPGKMDGSSIDDFLFNKKVGFCEHYAGSFATLMRLLHVPARVVIGFQGGSWNNFGDYLMVRSLDAHAWTEIWREDTSRWERVDPTATIAPLRLSLGGDFNRLGNAELNSGLSQDELKNYLHRSWLSHSFLQASLAWDALANQWNGFLLRYDFAYQMELLKKLGFIEGNRLVFFIWLAIGLAAFGLALRFYLQKANPQTDKMLSTYHKLCAPLAKIGLERGRSEGPLPFAKRTAEMFPELNETIDSVFSEFCKLRYGPQTNSEFERQWRRKARRLTRTFRTLTRKQMRVPNR